MVSRGALVAGIVLGVMFGSARHAGLRPRRPLLGRVGFAVGCNVVMTPVLALILFASGCPSASGSALALSLCGGRSSR
ncbi:hypothetical protein [Nonomuraea dietziae]|uniref:hypothetical protein n=1 Tax=Nonomuraea dietziae TaxID=65515 RepID=UPI0031D159B1